MHGDLESYLEFYGSRSWNGTQLVSVLESGEEVLAHLNFCYVFRHKRDLSDSVLSPAPLFYDESGADLSTKHHEDRVVVIHLLHCHHDHLQASNSCTDWVLQSGASQQHHNLLADVNSCSDTSIR